MNDLVVLSNEKMTVQECSGDVPTPRSGHAVAAYGKYMFLFGGIDFAEDADFNDLYVLDTGIFFFTKIKDCPLKISGFIFVFFFPCIDTYCWKYAGEAGVEVAGRNSHSMGVLQQGSQAVLVIYGGASCTLGPLNDTVYAVLPSVEEIGRFIGCLMTFFSQMQVHCCLIHYIYSQRRFFCHMAKVGSLA